MEFISLGALIYDLLNIIRGAEIADDEPITEKQVEGWIHQYRALFIKRDIDKNKYPNPDYIQTIDSIPLEYDSTHKVHQTTSDIPTTLDFNRKSGLLFVGDIYGNRIQLMPETRVTYQEHNTFTNDDVIAYLKARRLTLKNNKGLSTITVRGIFNIPSEAEELAGRTFTYDSYYPIPYDVVPALKKEILKNELGIEYNAPNDEVNNSKHELTDVSRQG